MKIEHLGTVWGKYTHSTGSPLRHSATRRRAGQAPSSVDLCWALSKHFASYSTLCRKAIQKPVSGFAGVEYTMCMAIGARWTVEPWTAEPWYL